MKVQVDAMYPEELKLTDVTWRIVEDQGPSGCPVVELEGEPAAVIAALRDSWGMDTSDIVEIIDTTDRVKCIEKLVEYMREATGDDVFSRNNFAQLIEYLSVTDEERESFIELLNGDFQDFTDDEIDIMQALDEVEHSDGGLEEECLELDERHAPHTVYTIDHVMNMVERFCPISRAVVAAKLLDAYREEGRLLGCDGEKECARTVLEAIKEWHGATAETVRDFLRRTVQ